MHDNGDIYSSAFSVLPRNIRGDARGREDRLRELLTSVQVLHAPREGREMQGRLRGPSIPRPIHRFILCCGWPQPQGHQKTHLGRGLDYRPALSFPVVSRLGTQVPQATECELEAGERVSHPSWPFIFLGHHI